MPAQQQRRVKRKERQTERRNEAQRPQQQRPQQQHVQQATRETGARPRTKVIRGTRKQCPLRAGLVTREFFIFRVDKEHTADDIKVFMQEQEVTVIDISCVSHADSYTNSYHVVAQAKNVDNMSMPDFWPEGIICVAVDSTASVTTNIKMATQATNDVLRICTYNCEGVKNSEIYISTLKYYDIICLQETWVQEHEVNKLSSIKSGYMAVSVSGIDNTKILQGRPYGGVFIMYRNELSARCESVKLDTRRACAVKL